jgi:fumarate hydratase subunit alpha
MVRVIEAQKITAAIRDLCMEANIYLPEELMRAYRQSMEGEASPLGRNILHLMVENAAAARAGGLPVCQDTGLIVVFADLGQEVHITGGDFAEAVHQGVRQGYQKGCFRASSVDPITRINRGDNSPAILHVEIVPGRDLKLSVLPKGFGGENFSEVRLFPPSFGMEGVKDFIVERIDRAGSSPCPPVIVGVGIGGTMEKAALIAKRSLLRPLGERHPNPQVAGMEGELLERINRLGIGPQGLGGTVTALDVHIETYPTHIASIPIAVNIQCSCHRHSSTVL